ncbi:DUF4870 domain-containing protein [Rubrobacter marinus]|uniref:DUF4870 domain-containing protein n=1 Tax=Rubrobacter marinus TaxID=2653852 RepID=A0A6G8PTE3_9ACTN|nr:DUF4870 domain-containing protein [Rubrobacter marinus]QIN77352.1 DUF4870 domain-containing protein [Rubrobacter marinus]
MQQDPNYGNEGESRLRRIRVGGEGNTGDETRGGSEYGSFGTSDQGPATDGSSLSARDERTWSMLSHLSVLLSLITGIGGPIAALVIWLVYKDRSDRVAFHAMQSLWYQVAWIVILGVGWTITALLSLVVIGLLLVPVMLLATFVPIVHQCYAAYKVNQGTDYRYPFVADMVDRNHRFG